MAYSKENKLRRIIDVQKAFKEHYQKGQTIQYVYDEHIYPTFKISKATFYKFMKMDAAKELKELLHENNLKKKRLEQLEMQF